MPAGELAVRLGARDLATRAFAFALFKVPSLAADPWWRENRDRSAAFDAALPQAIEMTPSYLRWELALMAGDTDQALRLAEPAVGGEVAMAIVQAWMGDATAADSLIAACKANPLDLYRLLWCARVEEHRGNNANAHELRLLANISLLSSYTAGAEMRVSPAGMVGRQLVGDPADLWATYTYRRPAPWDILVPSLIHLKVE
jgi:hypothetical protein